MIELFVILYMAIASGYAGGSLPYSHIFENELKPIPEILFAAGFVYALFPVIGSISIIAGIWSYIWMQTGHANVLPWGAGGHNEKRENTLSPFVKWLSDRFGIEHFSKNYARLFMAVKGFLIGLPVGGFTMMILWPLGYEIGNKAGKHWLSETLAGAGAGLSIILFRGYFWNG